MKRKLLVIGLLLVVVVVASIGCAYCDEEELVTKEGVVSHIELLPDGHVIKLKFESGARFLISDKPGKMGFLNLQKVFPGDEVRLRLCHLGDISWQIWAVVIIREGK